MPFSICADTVLFYSRCYYWPFLAAEEMTAQRKWETCPGFDSWQEAEPGLKSGLQDCRPPPNVITTLKTWEDGLCTEVWNCPRVNTNVCAFPQVSLHPHPGTGLSQPSHWLKALIKPTLCDPMDYTVHGIHSGFSRPEYWSGQLFPSPGDLPNPGLLHCR